MTRTLTETLAAVAFALLLAEIFVACFVMGG